MKETAIKGAKTIAEYAVRKWMIEQNFAAECFRLSMNGNTGIITDDFNASITAVYDPGTKTVKIVDTGKEEAL